ncbi:hypothetical protein [Micromonospora rifamycinica]|uniref:hypothetical protein n=1 Tax=Micromonospora rifamycinica TaxID=291594 RepID=UPI0012FD33FF|nr:hypothetical protein [Micromonospora rifamycinica]
MRYAAGPPAHWSIELRSGSVIDLWADAFRMENGHYLFTVLVEASPDELREVEVTSRSPSPSPGFVEVLAARIPEADVARVESAPARQAPGGLSIALPDTAPLSQRSGRPQGVKRRPMLTKNDHRRPDIEPAQSHDHGSELVGDGRVDLYAGLRR